MDDTTEKQSREAQLSGALANLSKDWKEQAEGKSKLRPRRFFLTVYLALMVYILSAGPLGGLLSAILPNSVAGRVWTCLYYPLVVWIRHQMPLARLLVAYLHLWGV